MAGKIKRSIDRIIAERSKGNPIIASSLRTKMILRGINVASYSDRSEDDPKILHVLQEIANEFGVKL